MIIDDLPSRNKVKLFASIFYTYKQLFANLSYFLKMLFPVGILILIFDVLIFYGEFYEIELVKFSSILIQLILFSIFAISWHRFIILGQDTENRISLTSIKKHEFNFIFLSLSWLLVFFAAFVIYKLGGLNRSYALFISIVSIISLLIFLHFILRLWMVLPAKAIDSNLSIGDIYKKSKGLTLKLLFGFLLLSFPIGYISKVYENYVYSNFSERFGFSFIFEYILLNLFELIVTVIVIALNAGFISRIFMCLQDKEQLHT